MLLIDRAWKANVNVWKRHLTLQSVFNHGESMVHVDKNVDGHILDQNVDRILRKIAYVPLSGRIRSKRSSCSPFLFSFLKKKMSTRHAYHWSSRFEVLDVLPRGPMDWNLGCASQRSMDLNLDMLSRGPMDWNLDVLPNDLMVWNLGRAS